MSRLLIRGQIYTFALSLHAGAKYGAKAYQTERRKGLRWQRTSLLRMTPPRGGSRSNSQLLRHVGQVLVSARHIHPAAPSLQGGLRQCGQLEADPSLLLPVSAGDLRSRLMTGSTAVQS